MILLPDNKDSQVEMLTEALKKQADEVSQGLDKIFGVVQPVEVTEEVIENPVIEVPKKLTDKMRLAEELNSAAGRMALRTNLLTRIYSHFQGRKTVNANSGK
jgi:hypothetical protein